MPSARPRRPRVSRTLSGLIALCLLAGCAAGIPRSALETVSRGVSFRDVRREPQAYRGQTLALGGIVMQLEAIPEGVLVAVREFPLDGGARHRPATDQPSRGYFLLRILRAERPDGLRAGAEITVVGEVIGTGSLPVAGGAEEVPLLVERYLRVWGPSWWPRFQIGIGGSISL